MADGSGRFGVLLQWYRLAAGLSQEELAEQAGLSRRGIAGLERGARHAAHRSPSRRGARAKDGDRATLLAAGQPDMTPRRALAGVVRLCVARDADQFRRL